ncbi:hypothetical protein AWL63_18105 [Sphingomonas panacis]|uniref:Uncharacterized protein n=1 Tax=Sphingomonas panacis TaxID=1560345 RepID=A0A1B3ZDQ6_9SPHN|nr:hypothetical protein AWL63_18105 [Sphingomonas panacis]
MIMAVLSTPIPQAATMGDDRSGACAVADATCALIGISDILEGRQPVTAVQNDVAGAEGR